MGRPLTGVAKAPCNGWLDACKRPPAGAATRRQPTVEAIAHRWPPAGTIGYGQLVGAAAARGHSRLQRGASRSSGVGRRGGASW
ncbi:hypothetical protein GW17_00012603 [Ensete ventricosum]|nr:hypothetical protein GW17_00012603 [Ensete ventricosum]RZS09339.1 hypothetical protein BHM03_00040402 [Ensete ventricosum]